SLGMERYGEHEDACQKQQHEGRDQAQELFEVTAFYRVVKPRRPGIQADLNRNLRNRQGRDHREAAPVPPFVLRREEGQGKKDKTPCKVGVIPHPYFGTGRVGRRDLRHGLSSPCLAQPCRKVPRQLTEKRAQAPRIASNRTSVSGSTPA